MPQVTLSLPIALGLLALFLLIGGWTVFALIQQEPEIVVPPTETATPTNTVTPTLTPTLAPPTETSPPEPSPTPFTYLVQDGDQCSTIANTFTISIQSIILLNNLDAACSLFVGQQLLIPFPTPTVTPQPSATLNATDQYVSDCSQVTYQVQENDTLSTISANYDVSIESIKRWNGLVLDQVNLGQTLIIPLCERGQDPGGATATPTPPPPYPAPNPLLPVDGAPFTAEHDNVTLQWASVGTLLNNEFYQVTIIDVTDGEARIVDYVVDTKYIIPSAFRPTETTAHVIRWTVQTVRQVGVDDSGLPLYEPAGAASTPRVFSWTGAP
ncbi:MAG TPA: LysM peptidoglycan-binding domain-containing protein [Anaerolineales bacterium]|nr:LysM peptidoglycan-binding domain-containing protein [Anaerolineales bacterium]